MIKLNKRGGLALAQITILILGMIAVGWALGSEVRTVSADGMPGAVAPKIHSVTKGENLWGIAKTNLGGTPTNAAIQLEVNRIAKVNSISNPNKIYPGQKITVGAGESAPAPLPVAAALPVAAGAVGARGTDLNLNGFPLNETNTGNGGSTGEILGAAGALGLGSLGANGTGLSLEYCKANPNSIGCAAINNQESTSTGSVTSGADAEKLVAGPAVGWGPVWKQMGEGLQWSMYVVGAIQIVGRIAGMEDKALNAASAAAFGGIMAGKTVYGMIQAGKLPASLAPKGGWGADGWFSSGKGELFEGTTKGGQASVVIAVVVAAIILYSMYKTESTETVSFTCEPWEAPIGGNMCEECNKQGILPCSEYQCRSLGQSCELTNKGTTEEKCVWVNRNDVTAPIIKLWNDALSKDHKYAKDTTTYPTGDTGTKIVYSKSSDGCIKAFTPLEFGIITDEPASCKLDYERKQGFDNMTYFLGGTSLLSYNHTQVMSLPGSSALAAENISIKNGGEYSLFIRCRDSNGNANTGTFVFRFCVDKGPDTTPPLIVSSNLLNNMPVAYNQSKVDLEVYTNEPATCRWSHLDQTYEKMETKMICSSSVLEMNAQMVYKCKTELNGIKNEAENKFFIKCEDQPSKPESERNRNAESYKFNLLGTKPIAITAILPNGTIKDSTETVKAVLELKTIGGYQEGNSTCYYSPTNSTAGEYIKFFNTDSYVHSQDLYLPEGDYTYYVKCVDLGGNTDINKTSFTIETDNEAPLVVRAYNEESNLKIITDESADCVYGSENCNYAFADGIKMSSVDENKTEHYIAWDTKKTAYIKCQDKYTNQVGANQCSIILRPFEEVAKDE